MKPLSIISSKSTKKEKAKLVISSRLQSHFVPWSHMCSAYRSLLQHEPPGPRRLLHHCHTSQIKYCLIKANDVSTLWADEWEKESALGSLCIYLLCLCVKSARPPVPAGPAAQPPIPLPTFPISFLWQALISCALILVTSVSVRVLAFRQISKYSCELLLPQEPILLNETKKFKFLSKL